MSLETPLSFITEEWGILSPFIEHSSFFNLERELRSMYVLEDLISYNKDLKIVPLSNATSPIKILELISECFSNKSFKTGRSTLAS